VGKVCAKISSIVQTVWPQYTRVPDRQTDDDKALTLWSAKN